MIPVLKSNVLIKSKGGRHSVYVDGIKMDGVTNISIKYERGSVCKATIELLSPKVENNV